MTSSTPPATTVTADAATSAEEKHLRSLGYKPEMHNGNKLWCKTESTIGTRLGDTKHCGTAENLAHVTNNSREMTEAAQRTNLSPPGK